MKVFVLGTGGWGIALAMLLHQNGHEVTSWTYLQEECDLLHRERCNEKLLPGVVIPEGIEITTDMSGAAKADLVVLAVPSFAVASTAERLATVMASQTCSWVIPGNSSVRLVTRERTDVMPFAASFFLSGLR